MDTEMMLTCLHTIKKKLIQLWTQVKGQHLVLRTDRY